MSSKIYDNTPIYPEGPSDAALKAVHQIYGLARVGLASTDAAVSLDLNKDGFAGIFEVIIGLATSAYDDLETLERKHRLGIYGPTIKDMEGVAQ